MMKIVVIFGLLFSYALALSTIQYQTAFVQYMHQHGKSYNHVEFQNRFNNFKANTDFINSHKSDSFTVAMNQFGDLSNVEFKAMFNGLKVPSGYVHKAIASPQMSLPDSWDWRQQGAVSGVKDQGQCGSCWAFSTTGSVEGCHFLSQKSLVGLSEQNLVDCSGSYGNEGCNGGLMTQAMDYIIANKGIDTEKSYPYTARDGTCRFNAANVGSTETAYTNVVSGSESDLQAKVYAGPTSVAIDASHSSFQFYSSGVYNEPSCSPSQLDHGVLAVGWGTSGSTAYWIVKNSWGTSWGQQGYIWMTRNKSNQCGIATMSTLPTGC